MVVGPASGYPARADLPAAVGATERVRLGLLGAADDRAAYRRVLAAADTTIAIRAGRACSWRRQRRAGRSAAFCGNNARPVECRLPEPGPGPARRRRPIRAPASRDQVADGRVPALRRLDHRPAGTRWLLGRYPAAMGLFAHRAAPARL